MIKKDENNNKTRSKILEAPPPDTVLRVQTVAGRTLVLTALLLQVVTLSYYTSNMVSALTVGPPLPPYKDLRDIHEEKSITFGMLKGTAETDILKV